MAFIVTFAAVSSANSAPAQPVCGDRAQLVTKLEKKYKETPHALGFASNDGLLEVLVSPDGHWTILISYPKRPTCVVAIGEDWHNRVILAGDPV
jgi:hypothetical protein